MLTAMPVWGQDEECFVSPEKDRLICSIKQSSSKPLGPIRVFNRTRVVVRVTEKNVFHSCSLSEVKLTEIKEADPIVTLIGWLGRAAVGTPGFAGAVNRATPPSPSEELYDVVSRLERQISDSLTTSKATAERLKGYAERIRVFSNGLDSSEKYKARIESVRAWVPDLRTELNSTTDLSMDNVQALYAQLRAQAQTLPADDSNLPSIMGLLDQVNAQLSPLRSNYESVNAARTLARAFLGAIEGVEIQVREAKNETDPFTQDLSLLEYSQQAASTTLTCTNSITGKPATSVLPVNVQYRRKFPVSASVGALVTSTDKRKLGTTQIRTGTDANGAPTFLNTFAEIDRSSYQIAPFVFGNWELFSLDGKGKFQPSKYALNFSAGIGVNPNSGSNEVEYFIGPSFTLDRFIVHVGDHYGRFQKGFSGGFAVGDTVPANFGVAPIEREYRHGFGIAITYRLPL
jgi:hypothetical protein